MRTTQSRGLMILGSGTVSMPTFSLPCQQRARMGISLVRWACVQRSHGAMRALNASQKFSPAARWQSFDGRDFAGFHELFEAAQVLAHGLPGLGPEDPG